MTSSMSTTLPSSPVDYIVYTTDVHHGSSNEDSRHPEHWHALEHCAHLRCNGFHVSLVRVDNSTGHREVLIAYE